MFKIDLIVWKHNDKNYTDPYLKGFKIDLIVWKQHDMTLDNSWYASLK